ncbi:MAG: S8 family serine peptidase [Clostridiales Family XIII bacterium]|jgi:subtilisin family serine protease|nr:S8 family serine peptidase [Clostridiales Family XIII bacterium]
MKSFNKFVKKLLNIALIAALAMGISLGEAGASGSPGYGTDEFARLTTQIISQNWSDDFFASATIAAGDKAIDVEGREDIATDGEAFRAHDEIMVPAEALVQLMGGEVEYDPANGTISDEANGIVAEFEVGSNTVIINSDTQITMEESPEMKDGVMFVPVSAAEDFGYEVQGDGESVTITRPYQTKRLVVKTSDNVETYGATGVIRGTADGLTVLQYATEDEAKAAYEAYSKLGGIEFVDIDSVIYASDVGTAELSPGTSWGRAYIRSDIFNAYLTQKNLAARSVTVAVIDTGVDSGHPFLSGRVLTANKNFSGSGTENSSYDDNSHGTYVAGIVADNTLPNVNILPVKVLDSTGSGTDLTAYNGIYFAIGQSVDVINMSFGGLGTSNTQKTACTAAMNANIAVVVAAGNDGKDAGAYSPANVPGVITVGAVNKNGNRASFSNFGTCVDIYAPGVSIEGIIPVAKGSYTVGSGTSMATPFAAAAAAMLKTADRSLGNADINTIMKTYGSGNPLHVDVGEFGARFGENPTQPPEDPPTQPPDPEDPPTPPSTPSDTLAIEPIPAQTWTSNKITPEITVKVGEITLLAGQYGVEYGANIDVGATSGIVTVTGRLLYRNLTATANFTITGKPVTETDITIDDIAPMTYTGAPLTPDVIVKDGSQTLTKGMDYRVEYFDNVDAGSAAYVRVAGSGLYTGFKDKTFTINASPSLPSLPVLTGTVTISGSLTYGETLTAETDALTASAGDVPGVFSYQWKRSGDDSTIGTNKSYTLVAADVGQSVAVTVAASNCTGIIPSDPAGPVAKKEVTVMPGSGQAKVYGEADPVLAYALSPGFVSGDTPFNSFNGALSRANGENAGTYAINMGDLTSSKYAPALASEPVAFTISKRALTGATVTLSGTSFAYTGSEIKPVVLAVAADGVRAVSTDYTVAYSNNTLPGTATVTLTATAGGNFSGTASVNFTIEAAFGGAGSGDLDSDGAATIADALLAAGAVLNSGLLNEAQKLAADMDNDGRITMADVILIAKKAAGL